MVTKYDYERLNVTICPLEKDTLENRSTGKTRMKYIQEFFEGHDATVTKVYKPYIDYELKGQIVKTKDGKEEILNIDLGIQVKTLSGDLFPSLPTLSDNLFRAFQNYKDVALLVIENGGYDIALNEDGSDGLFQNQKMQNGSGKGGLGLYSSYTNFMASMQRFEIHARQIRLNEHIPMSIHAIMTFAAKPLHEGLRVRPLNYSDRLMNVFGSIEGIGPVSAQKLLQYIPSIEGLVKCPEKKLQDILGLLKGKQTYQFLHSDNNDATCNVNWAAFVTGQKKLDMPRKDFLTKPKLAKVAEPIVYHENKKTVNPNHILQFDPVLEAVRKKDCTIEDIKAETGFSETMVFKSIMELKEKKKIWKNNITRLWCFGSDKNEVPIVANIPLKVL